MSGVNDLKDWHQRIASSYKPPVSFEIDKQFCIASCEGQPSLYGLDVDVGDDLRQALPLLYGEPLDADIKLEFVMTADGAIVDVQINAFAEGAYVSLTDAMPRHDIAQKIQQERNEIQLLRVQLGRANSSKDRLLAATSNEFRIPLLAIRGQLQPLAVAAQASEGAQNAISTIGHAVDQLDTLVGNLIDVSQLESDQTIISRLPVSIRTFLNTWFEAYKHSSLARGVRLKVVVGDDVPESLSVDPIKIRQILVHLLQRAINVGNCSRVKIEATWAEDTLKLQVHDNGDKIPIEQREQLFVPLNEISGSTPIEALGLFVAAESARKMGGKISFESSKRSGAHFIVSVNAPSDQRK